VGSLVIVMGFLRLCMISSCCVIAGGICMVSWDLLHLLGFELSTLSKGVGDMLRDILPFATGSLKGGLS